MDLLLTYVRLEFLLAVLMKTPLNSHRMCIGAACGRFVNCPLRHNVAGANALFVSGSHYAERVYSEPNVLS